MVIIALASGCPSCRDNARGDFAFMGTVFDVYMDDHYQPTIDLANRDPAVREPFVRDADGKRVMEQEQRPFKTDAVLPEIRGGLPGIPSEPEAHAGSYALKVSRHLSAAINRLSRPAPSRLGARNKPAAAELLPAERADGDEVPTFSWRRNARVRGSPGAAP
jgi:hypothetical protein